MFALTDLTPGDVYDPKEPGQPRIAIQVGRGGDCGVFLGACESQTFEVAPAFRVPVNQTDLRRHWRKVGTFKFGPGMDEFAWYGVAEINRPERFKVSLEHVEIRIPIDEAEFRQLERLAVWETVHILGRLSGISYFGDERRKPAG